MKDRSDELSTADLAGQSAGSGGADERAGRGEPADRMAERDDAFPGDRSADADYADDRGDYADDRVGGMGSGGFPGGTPADRAVYADDPTAGDDAAVTGDSTRYAGDPVGDGDNPAVGGDGAGYTGDRAAYAENPAVAGDRAGYGDDVTGDRAGYGDDRDSVGAAAVGDRGVAGGRGVDAAAADRDQPTGEVREPAAASTAGSAGNGVAGTGDAGPLLGGAESEGFRARWTDVQTGFVDAPRRSVEQADALVAELMQHLAKSFADERSRLESQWDRGEDIHTDDLRTAFQRYRSFFERLLST